MNEMKFSRLAAFFAKLEATTSRNEIAGTLADLFREAKEDEIAKICYLALGELVPTYRGIEFSIAEKMLLKALAVAYNTPASQVQARYKNKGDLGDTAEILALNIAPKQELTVADVYERLMEIAKESGTGSQERKIRKTSDLLVSLDPLSAKFVARILIAKLRLGFSDITMLDALSFMIKGDKSGRMAIEQAFNITADIGEIASKVKRGGLSALAQLNPKPGVPIRPSLTERIPDMRDIIRKLGPIVAVEPKLDGLRTQIHLWSKGGKKHVVIFSRNLENTTHMFPEIVKAAQGLAVSSAIFDGEAIGYDPKSGRFAAFQETVQRKRKHGIDEMVKKIPLAIFVFDVMYINGESLLEKPFSSRRAVLEKTLVKASGAASKKAAGNQSKALQIINQRLASNADDIEEELKKAMRAGLEGVMIKNLNSRYEAGSRGFHWVKFKPTTTALADIRGRLPVLSSANKQPDTTKQLTDTIDCVVMGVYKGRGKRTKFGAGGFLLGVKGSDGNFYTISKLGTGLSDENLRNMFILAKTLHAKTAPREYVVSKEIFPDMWMRPSLIVEIIADEITLSPRHTAGKKEMRGYSLRFPRLVRQRPDKNPEDATTVAEIEKMYRFQRQLRHVCFKRPPNAG